jgi:hypothetical protein
LKREADYFDEEPLVLVFIAKKLREALALEEYLTAAAVDYYIEVDTYTGGVIFRSERAGAFFYVRETERDAVAELMRKSGYKPQQDLAESDRSGP